MSNAKISDTSKVNAKKINSTTLKSSSSHIVTQTKTTSRNTTDKNNRKLPTQTTILAASRASHYSNQYSKSSVNESEGPVDRHKKTKKKSDIIKDSSHSDNNSIAYNRSQSAHVHQIEVSKNNANSGKPLTSQFKSSSGKEEIIVLKDPIVREAAIALGLNQSYLRKLKLKFREIDVDDTGSIGLKEFLEFVDETQSPFTDALFHMIDVDGSGSIEFEEYIRILATYCMFSKDEILRFCFDTFDTDHSGSISEDEFIALCKNVNNAAPLFPGNFKRALEEFDVNQDGMIDYNEFCEIERKYPMILFPAFRLQNTMQRVSLGERAWVRIIESYERRRVIAEYKEAHGGNGPPKSCVELILSYIFPYENEAPYIPLGARLENKHKNNATGTTVVNIEGSGKTLTAAANRSKLRQKKSGVDG